MFDWLVRVLNREKALPRPLDLRGFSMTRAEAAGWIRVAAECIEVDAAPDSHPSLADNVEVARRDDLLAWSRGWRRSFAHEVCIGAREPNENAAYFRLVSAILLAAWRGPDFRTEAP